MLPAARATGSLTRLCTACRAVSSQSTAAPTSSRSEAESADQLRRRVLDKAVSLVPEHGWTRGCVEAGTRALDLPESVADMAAPRGGADLALHFADVCNDRLEAALRARAAAAAVGMETSAMSLDVIRFACRERLGMLHPVLPHWPAALATLTGSPVLAADGLARIQRLADDVCHYAGDRSTNSTWYVRRAAVAAVYCSTEVFMLQDSSPGLTDTWGFLDRRIAGELAVLEAAPGIARAFSTVAVNMLGLKR